MAKTWYPVVDYLVCTQCGTCIAQCPHGVYDAAKAPSPAVKYPGACVDHCHGCGNRCPVGAITYVGDDTGWTPSHGTLEAKDSGCACGCGDGCANLALVEYLYLDLQTCDRCIGTGGELDEVMAAITPALRLAGYDVKYHKIEITDEDLAVGHRFLSSPTIRVNGRDLFGSVQENSCGCCSDISGTDVNCRVFTYDGELVDVPPKAMLAKEILAAVLSGEARGCDGEAYTLPDNLRGFFKGKAGKKCSCTGGCCP